MTQNLELTNIQEKLVPLKEKLIGHKLYNSIKTPEHLRIFMEHHVFAVWDFMSLLKSLQIHLTSTSLPWFPKSNGELRYFINSIVLDEESDIDFMGNRKSHFEMYLDAMEQGGASQTDIFEFTELLKTFNSIELALTSVKASSAVASFVNHTFDVIKSGKIHKIASVFTFGREDLIPDMFVSIVQNLNNNFSGQFALLKYYLDRHIELDGDIHNKLALNMVNELCGSNKILWQEALDTSLKTLQLRIELWDEIYIKINNVNSHSPILNY
jgi:hypothetical protein